MHFILDMCWQFILVMQALSCLSGIELSALNVNVSELLDQTVAYFMGSGSSRFNSQVSK